MKIFGNTLSDKGLACKIYKENLKLSNKKTDYSIKKWTKDVNSYVTKEEIQKVNKHKKMLNILCHQGFANLNNEIQLYIHWNG